MASRQFFRNLLSLDDKLCTIEAVIAFNANGSPMLQQWTPDFPGASTGSYNNAPIGGCEGVVGVFKRTTGDFRIVLQDGYVRSKGFLPSYTNSAHVGIAAPTVYNVAGSLSSTYPDLTDYSVERLEAGHSGTAADAAQPTFTVNSATFPSSVIGMLFTDSAGVEATILDAATDTITLSGVVTPATDAGWTITSNGTLVLDSTILSGARSSTAFSAATFTVGGATWLVNRWVNHILHDSAGAQLRIASNTATVITLEAISEGTNPTTGAYIIEQGFAPGSVYSVTGPQVTGTGNTGTGTANTWTPATHTNWVAGMFAGMFLLDPDGVQWQITANSTTALTVASNGSLTTPTTGTSWSIISVAGQASVEITTSALAGSASGLTFAGTAHTITGTVAAPTFTGTAGTAAVDNTPAFTGTGYTVAGQVITTTDNQTMALDRCAGMLFMSDSGDVCEIVSNTAVTGAPAVLTVVGKATTDAGGYTIFKGTTPAGTNSAPAFTGESYTPAGTVSGTLTASLSATDPASGEQLEVLMVLSDGVVME